MTKVYSKALKKSIDISRIIGKIKGESPGPTLIFTGGIHGNEPSGVFALHQVLEEIHSEKIPVKGNIYAVAGNLNALQAGIRYQKKDLNRIWTEEYMNGYKNTKDGSEQEFHEQAEIYKIISEITSKEVGPFYFIDLHTTSSDTKPFITINDTLLNRKFSIQYPVPLLLGIEEYLEGTLLNYINRLGYIAFGFESGQHDARSSIEMHTAFVYLSLVFTNSISQSSIKYEYYYELLAQATKGLADNYEIIFHHEVKKDHIFYMYPGYQNFEPVKKGRTIAESNGKAIRISENGFIFMPLYQKQGEDGFFIIKAIPKVFLYLSALARKIHLDYILPLLPGIRWASKNRDSLKVDLKVAKFFAKKLFHLLGYRSRQIGNDTITIRNREANSLKEMYKKSAWY